MARLLDWLIWVWMRWRISPEEAVEALKPLGEESGACGGAKSVGVGVVLLEEEDEDEEEEPPKSPILDLLMW